MSDFLRFMTCGSVDDGKSTLIGHLLYDAKMLFADQERALELESLSSDAQGERDYSLLLDGLSAEREQGITIDVAYRYFATEKRSFIVADTPGHEEYTRNMAVAASESELAVLLTDAVRGVRVQTKRHLRICRMMGIKEYVFAVNKMDAAGYSEEVFRTIEDELKALTAEMTDVRVAVIPLSALKGDNVTGRSLNMSWYSGPSLLEYLENVQV
ncbi:MAG: sulfate adenylyltransferase, partial [Mogibacterium sp.]|nr:sulfate adenylyltransferase [Mogibacterium sp.]